VDSLKNLNTKRKTTSDLNIFTKWLRTNNEVRNPDEIPSMELDKLLARFFNSSQK
jgi:hypothetical protein